MNVCGACGLDFSSLRAFDGHRVGRHGYSLREGLALVPAREDGRHCLVAHELVAAGFAQDGRGRWGIVEHRLRAAERFSVDPGTLQRAA